MSRIAVVVPAKDEAPTIGALLDGISRIVVPGHTLHPIVVDDGSTDATASLARDRGAIVVAHPANRGLGAAVRTGLRAAVDSGAAAVAYLDAETLLGSQTQLSYQLALKALDGKWSLLRTAMKG